MSFININIFNYIIILAIPIFQVIITWYFCWNYILIHIPIVREVSGMEQPLHKYSNKFNLEFKN